MKITKVSVHESYTFNLGNYNNIKPAVSIEAELGEGDDVHQVCQELQALAREKVYGEIDHELERDGRPPEFYDGPLYNAVHCKGERLTLIVAEAQRDELPGHWSNLGSLFYGRGHRLERVRAMCREQYPSKEILDVSDGDFSQVPLVESFPVFVVDDEDEVKGKYLVLGQSNSTRDDLPASWQGWWVDTNYTTRLKENLLAELKQKAEGEDFTFFNCSAGDYGQLPELERVQEAADEDY